VISPAIVDPDRRRILRLSLLTLVPALIQRGETAVAAGGAGPERDFDFFLGTWDVHHRRLKKRLANNDEWEEFEGSTHCESLLGGIANLNDSVSQRASGVFRGLGLRAFDAKTQTWADWWLDGRNPTKIDIPGAGRFANGVGTFLSDDTFEGRPIKVRGLWSRITPASFQWEQAFSPDGGKTWETNWVMRYTRTAPARAGLR
jgi:hypothetical protein